MTFTLLPAVDVAGARAVRHAQSPGTSDGVGGDPVEIALRWQAGGAEWIHLVDLDAAFGRGSNTELLASVIAALDAKVQLSGGVSDDPSLERALASGCARVVVGTAALSDPAWCTRAIAAHGDRIAFAVDVRAASHADASVRYELAARGSAGSGGDVWETLDWLEHAGCARYVITDVGKDGMLNGPNVELYRAITEAIASPVIASGGVSAIADLVALVELAAGAAALEGAIVGTALSAGHFTVAEALSAVRRVG